MKQIKFGTVEILGYIGGIVWVAVIFLRGKLLPLNEIAIFLLGILPNLGAAWSITMITKWIVLFILKRDVTIKIHTVICVSIFILAVVSEVIHDLFLNAPFDAYDIMLTTIAQAIIFFIPVLTKDKYFANYKV